jgi:hypothetical protein
MILSTHVNIKVSVSHCYQTCPFTIYKGDAALRIVDAKSIQSVVSMIPYFKILENGNFETPATKLFLMEKPGLDIASFWGEEVVDDDDDELYV